MDWEVLHTIYGEQLDFKEAEHRFYEIEGFWFSLELNYLYKRPFYFKLGVIPRSLLRQFEIRDFRLEAERNTPSACCGDFKNFVLDSAQELQIPDIAKA